MVDTTVWLYKIASRLPDHLAKVLASILISLTLLYSTTASLFSLRVTLTTPVEFQLLSGTNAFSVTHQKRFPPRASCFVSALSSLTDTLVDTLAFTRIQNLFVRTLVHIRKLIILTFDRATMT